MVYDKGITTKTVQGVWQKLIDSFGPEIEVLINTPLDDIGKIDEKLALAIEGFREKTLHIVPGGGGKYGEISFDENLVEEEKQDNLTTLDSFF
jgi:PHP family Zn ribbon phosphoesterase